MKSRCSRRVQRYSADVCAANDVKCYVCIFVFKKRAFLQRMHCITTLLRSFFFSLKNLVLLSALYLHISAAIIVCWNKPATTITCSIQKTKQKQKCLGLTFCFNFLLVSEPNPPKIQISVSGKSSPTDPCSGSRGFLTFKKCSKMRIHGEKIQYTLFWKRTNFQCLVGGATWEVFLRINFTKG